MFREKNTRRKTLTGADDRSDFWQRTPGADTRLTDDRPGTDSEVVQSRRLRMLRSDFRVGPDRPTGCPSDSTLASIPVLISIGPASDDTQAQLAGWRYPPPYDFYDGDAEPVLNPERFFEARDEHDDLIGFYYFEPKPPDLDYGLGLRPDLTGRGLGARVLPRRPCVRTRPLPPGPCVSPRGCLQPRGRAASTSARAFRSSRHTSGHSSGSGTSPS